ncbi:MAG: hypothetical protein RR185_08210 [Angelakisella sp.]
MIFQENDAPVLIVLGQSNAHGHGTQLAKSQQLIAPLKNVKGLARSHNQSFGLSDVTWSGFTSFGMNLGETQDNTCCLAEQFARRWQGYIDAGNPYSLPDLYVIQISIGAMGVDRDERDGLNMWWPERPRVLQPGSLGIADISLYPLATEIFGLAMQNLKGSGKTPRIIGLHWNQWETEVDTGGAVLARAKENYRRLFSGFRDALGSAYPLYLYRPISQVYQNPEGLLAMDALLTSFAQQDARVRLLDLTESVLYRPEREDKGIFQPDLVHYSPAAHGWFADMQLHDVLCRK